MSLLVTAALVAGGVVAGRYLARAVRAAASRIGKSPSQLEAGHDTEGGDAPADDAPRARIRVAPDATFEAFPCQLGDVILALGTDEAWLAGALLLSDQGPAVALFIAPDAGGDRAVLVRPRPSEDVVWLTPIDAKALGLAAEPPSSLEHDGERFERKRRLPLRVERYGTGAPDVGETVVLAEYTNASGDELVVLAAGEATRAWSGRRLNAGMYEVLASGKATLES